MVTFAIVLMWYYPFRLPYRRLQLRQFDRIHPFVYDLCHPMFVLLHPIYVLCVWEFVYIRNVRRCMFVKKEIINFIIKQHAYLPESIHQVNDTINRKCPSYAQPYKLTSLLKAHTTLFKPLHTLSNIHQRPVNTQNTNRYRTHTQQISI